MLCLQRLVSCLLVCLWKTCRLLLLFALPFGLLFVLRSSYPAVRSSELLQITFDHLFLIIYLFLIVQELRSSAGQHAPLPCLLRKGYEYFPSSACVSLLFFICSSRRYFRGRSHVYSVWNYSFYLSANLLFRTGKTHKSTMPHRPNGDSPFCTFCSPCEVNQTDSTLFFLCIQIALALSLHKDFILSFVDSHV